MPQTPFSQSELQDAWAILSDADRMEGFSLLSHGDAEEVFEGLDTTQQAALIASMSAGERRLWLRVLAPDDVADLIQAAPLEERENLLALLDPMTQREVTALLAYAEDDAGGLMSPRFARLRPDMSVDAAITYLRKQSRETVESIYHAYVLDSQQRLLGVVSLRELFSAASGKFVADVMRRDVVTVNEEMDQEAVSNVLAEHDLIAIPVVDNDGVMKGVITVDDIVDVVREEATEDIQKIGGMAALEAPYLETTIVQMLRKRVGWLVLLLVLSFVTVQAMQRYQKAIDAISILAIFVPMIISTGGNSGSQASTLVIRAIALSELRLRDWLRVVRRELTVGVSVGATLGAIAGSAVLAIHVVTGLFGEHAPRIAAVVSTSILCVSTWGTLVGSMLPFVLRRFGFDPASASAPLVATLCDAAGIVTYFSIATAILRGIAS